MSATAAVSAHAQTVVNGTSMPLNSNSTSTQSTNPTLSSNGYLGTYLVVPAGGATINFTANATEGSGSGTAPHMNIAIADSNLGFTVSSTSATNYTTSNITLPAGTYLVSDQRDYNGNVGVTRSETLNSLTVHTVTGSRHNFLQREHRRQRQRPGGCQHVH